MKRVFLFLALVVLAASCTSKPVGDVIYEMNVRQYTEDGTFAAAQQELPRLKELGVDIVWLMPIYQIGEKERKGTLGSYYAIKDYKTPNPEFGTLEDFDSFLAAAHKEGLRVVLDWVANHTSPDAAWVTSQDPSWYYRDSLGNTMVEYDWTDIAKLNYDNEEVREAMVDAMRFWLDRGIDGFRCDMAYIVPQDFWTPTFAQLKKEYGNDLYLLAEGEEPWLHDAGFQVSYAWRLHHMLNDIAQGKANVDSLKNYITEDAAKFPGARRLMFTSNHDENSWSGSEMERMGAAHKLMAVLTFVLPNGEPLIYTGQEVGYDHRLAFFEKDAVPSWYPNEYTSFYKRMTGLRHNHPALIDGEYMLLDDQWVPDDVLAFTMTDKDEQILVLANFSDKYETCALPESVEWEDAFTDEVLADELVAPVVGPWGWRILIRK